MDRLYLTDFVTPLERAAKTEAVAAAYKDGFFFCLSLTTQLPLRTSGTRLLGRRSWLLVRRRLRCAISAVSRSALRRRTKRSWRGQTNGVLCLFVTMHRFRDSYGQKGVWKGEGESDLIVLPTRMGNRCDVG